ncbi:unnamed protein product [Brachionus calyciflorus]|uniref:BZIP domain-containing protein n=1 Tax=Brachionus calyciflorus TaxID=104777 RepID=A0A813VCB1_9BILA|nr:unnamed protein product [Brachionus calyciflorus]
MDIELETLLSQDIDLGFNLSDINCPIDLKEFQQDEPRRDEKNENSFISDGYKIILEDETGENFMVISNDDIIIESNKTQFQNGDINNFDSLNILDDNWFNQILGEQSNQLTEMVQLNNFESTNISFEYDDKIKNQEIDTNSTNSIKLTEKKSKKITRKSDNEKSEKYKLRYEQFLIENQIPLKLSQIVETTPNEFNDLIVEKKLNSDQVFQVKDIRRKVKNKKAAQSCRRRRHDSIENLAEQVEELKKKRAILYSETANLQNQVQETLEIFNSLYQNSIGNIFNSSDPKIAVFNDFHTKLNTNDIENTDLDFFNLDFNSTGRDTGDDEYEEDEYVHLIVDNDLEELKF